MTRKTPLLLPLALLLALSACKPAQEPTPASSQPPAQAPTPATPQRWRRSRPNVPPPSSRR